MKKRLAKKLHLSKMKKGGKIRKYQDGGKGPLASNYKSSEDVAKETVSRLTSIPGAPSPSTLGTVKAATPTPVKAKRRADGFQSDAQKAAYIKNAKAMLAKGETIDSLVKMKFGTAAGLKALGITDSSKKESDSKKATPKPKSSDNNKKTTTLKYDNTEALRLKRKGTELKKKGQVLAKTGRAENKKWEGIKNIANFLIEPSVKNAIKAGTVSKKDMPKAIKAAKNESNISVGIVGGGGLGSLLLPTGIAEAGTGVKYIQAIKDFIKKNPSATAKEAGEAVKKTFTEWTKSGSKSATRPTKQSISRSKSLTRKTNTRKPNLDDILEKGESSTRTRSEWMQQGTKGKTKNIDEVLAAGEKSKPKFNAYTRKTAPKPKTPVRAPKRSINKSEQIANRYTSKVKGSTTKKLNYKKAIELQPIPKKTNVSRLKDIYSKFIKPKQNVFGERGQYLRLEDMKASEASRRISNGYKKGGKINSTKKGGKKR